MQVGSLDGLSLVYNSIQLVPKFSNFVNMLAFLLMSSFKCNEKVSKNSSGNGYLQKMAPNAVAGTNNQYYSLNIDKSAKLSGMFTEW